MGKLRERFQCGWNAAQVDLGAACSSGSEKFSGSRERAGVPSRRLAALAAVDVHQLCHQEAGTAQISTAKLERIASPLGLDPMALCAGQELTRTLVAHPKHAGRTDFRHEDLPVLDRAQVHAGALRELNRLLGRQTLSFD